MPDKPQPSRLADILSLSFLIGEKERELEELKHKLAKIQDRGPGKRLLENRANRRLEMMELHQLIQELKGKISANGEKIKKSTIIREYLKQKYFKGGKGQSETVAEQRAKGEYEKYRQAYIDFIKNKNM